MFINFTALGRSNTEGMKIYLTVSVKTIIHNIVK